MVDNLKLPTHLGIIIDGNGRWAKERGMDRTLGHRAGFRNLKKILRECFYKYDIKYVSIYAFSTENWNRPEKEVNYLIELFRKYFNLDFLEDYPDVRLNVMGDYTKFPKDIADSITEVMEKTKDITTHTLNLGLNYGGHDELVRAVNNIISEKIQIVDKDIIADHLYTKGQPPLDLLIRTSGEERISNFMLWQISYAEFYFPKVYWPSFNCRDLYKAFKEYSRRNRRFGAIKE